MRAVIRSLVDFDTERYVWVWRHCRAELTAEQCESFGIDSSLRFIQRDLDRLGIEVTW
jgi:hypothetical protein